MSSTMHSLPRRRGSCPPLKNAAASRGGCPLRPFLPIPSPARIFAPCKATMSQESSLLQPSRRDPNRVLPRGTPSPPLLVREKSAHRDHTDLDNGAAEITVEHFHPAVPRERICRRRRTGLSRLAEGAAR